MASITYEVSCGTWEVSVLQTRCLQSGFSGKVHKTHNDDHQPFRQLFRQGGVDPSATIVAFDRTGARVARAGRWITDPGNGIPSINNEGRATESFRDILALAESRSSQLATSRINYKAGGY